MAVVNDEEAVTLPFKSFIMSGDAPAGRGAPGLPGVKEVLRIVSNKHRLRVACRFRSLTSCVTYDDRFKN